MGICRPQASAKGVGWSRGHPHVQLVARGVCMFLGPDDPARSPTTLSDCCSQATAEGGGLFPADGDAPTPSAFPGPSGMRLTQGGPRYAPCPSAPPHTASDTLEFLPVLARPWGDREAPWRYRGAPDHPLHTAADTPKSLWSCLGLGGIGTPRGGLSRHCTTHPHTAADTPESLLSCQGCGGLETPRGGSRRH